MDITDWIRNIFTCPTIGANTVSSKFVFTTLLSERRGPCCRDSNLLTHALVMSLNDAVAATKHGFGQWNGRIHFCISFATVLSNSVNGWDRSSFSPIWSIITLLASSLQSSSWWENCSLSACCVVYTYSILIQANCFNCSAINRTNSKLGRSRYD